MPKAYRINRYKRRKRLAGDFRLDGHGRYFSRRRASLHDGFLLESMEQRERESILMARDEIEEEEGWA